MKLTRKFIREYCYADDIRNYLCYIASLPHNIVQDEITLSDNEKASLMNILNKYPCSKKFFIKEGLIEEEEDKNPFKKDLSTNDINNLQNVLYNIFESYMLRCRE